MKRCLTSFLIREMQNKTIMRYHLTQIRMAIIKKSTNNKCWRGFREKGIFLYCWWKINCYNHYGKQYWCSSKTKYRTTTVYSRPTPGHLSRENHNSERHMYPPQWSLQIFLQWKQPKVPLTEEWIKKLWYIYTMEYYSAIKRMKLCHLQQCEWN